MTSALFDFPYFNYNLFLWIVFSAAVLCIYGIQSIISSRNKISIMQYVFGMGLISTGFVTGVIMGNNRSPIGDTIMTSKFALVGTIVAYMFIKKREGATNEECRQNALGDEKNQLTAGIFLIIFPLRCFTERI